MSTFDLNSIDVKYVSPRWLEERLHSDLVILDAQPNVHDFIRGHVPGAVYLAEESLRLTRNGMPHQWLPNDLATAVLSQVGVATNEEVLVYTSTNASVPTGDGVPQGLVAYSLVRYGHSKVRILDGGLDDWRAAGMEISTSYVESPRTKFVATDDTGLHLGYDEFVKLVAAPGTLHIDSRPSEQYQGKSPWPSPGHIPGAVSLPWSECFSKDNLCRLRPRGEIESAIERAGATRGREIVLSCGSGRKSAAQLMVMRFLLGYERVRLFEGSLTEWLAHPDNKTVTGPSPF